MTRRRANLDLLVAVLTLAAAVCIQEGVIAHLQPGGFTPNIVLLVVVDWVLLRGVREGLVCALIAGVYLDLFSGLPFGTSALAFVCVAALLSLRETTMIRTSLVLHIGAAILATVVFYGVAIFAMASVDHQLLTTPDVLRDVGIVAGLNGLFNPFVFRICSWASDWMHPVRRAVW